MAKKVTVTFMALVVAALHFFTGEGYRGPFPIFVNGYLIDVLLPMVLFLLMGLFDNKLIRSMLFRIGAVFGFGCFVEVSQFLGHPIFGSTFDPYDILAYAVGILFGVLLETFVFSQFIPNWNEE